jgi:DNA-binding response OmpR family regulator
VPAVMESVLPQGNIMIVDDNPSNLILLEEMFREQAYEVRSFPRGRLALSAADLRPPDLILLDINMPDMDGYEVCEQLKSSPRLCATPVIFLSALNSMEDKTKAFRSGAVDYISKPFQVEEVQARVETHLKLRRAQQLEHDLLQNTLGGAVGTLWQLVQLISPVLALRSAAVRDIVLWVTERMGIEDAWQCELAATLCLLGCLALPDDVFKRAYSRQALSPDEDRMFRAHPESAARLLSNIPRLQQVAEMIRGQQRTAEEPVLPAESRQGAELLYLALQLDQRVYLGVTPSAALGELRSLGQFDGRMLSALARYSPVKAEFEMRRLPIRELGAGMVLDNDVFSENGQVLILKEGTILTEIWIERLKNFARSWDTHELISVRLPRVAGLRMSNEFGRVPVTGAQKA